MAVRLVRSFFYGVGCYHSLKMLLASRWSFCSFLSWHMHIWSRNNDLQVLWTHYCIAMRVYLGEWVKFPLYGSHVGPCSLPCHGMLRLWFCLNSWPPYTTRAFYVLYHIHNLYTPVVLYSFAHGKPDLYVQSVECRRNENIHIPCRRLLKVLSCVICQC